MRLIATAAVAAAVAGLAACSSAGSSSSSAVATQAAAPASAPAAPTLAPLTLGAFPSTTDGTLARDICQAWTGLRQQYAAQLGADTAYELNQWFSGPDWAPVQSDATKLGNDPAYGNIETALGLVITGDAASTANAQLLDKACAAAD
jgi:hypothetical protein